MLNPDKAAGLGISVLILAGVLFIWKNEAPAPMPDSSGREFPIAAQPPADTTIVAVGDILLSRHVGAKIDEANDPHLPFAKLKDLLAGADITFGNLECPLVDSNVPIREGLVFRCLTKYVPGLAAAGFDVLSLANNHSFDQGAAAISFTRDFLLSQNILPVGAGSAQEEAWTPAIKEINGMKFAFLAVSYASVNDGGKSRNDYVARLEDIEILKSKISNLFAQGGSASGGKSKPFIIVSMHAGAEYTRRPQEEQTNFARAAIDAGADIVIGHHPHWIQSVEIYPPFSPPAPSGSPPPSSLSPGGRGEGEGEIHRGLIFYSLGNFVFDQMWSQDTREGLAVKLQISNNKSLKAELIPVIIENYCCPRLADDKEKTAILEKINLESSVINFNP